MQQTPPWPKKRYINTLPFLFLFMDGDSGEPMEEDDVTHVTGVGRGDTNKVSSMRRSP